MGVHTVANSQVSRRLRAFARSDACFWVFVMRVPLWDLRLRAFARSDAPLCRHPRRGSGAQSIETVL